MTRPKDGDIVTSKSGKKIKFDRMITGGGQGVAYFATEMKKNQPCVVKIFSKKEEREKNISRISFLVDQKFYQSCSTCISPIDVIITDDWVGHYTFVAPGKPLEGFLGEINSYSIIQGIIWSIVLSNAIDVLHCKGISHGDIHSQNVFIDNDKLYLIDFDNFSSSKMPPPPCMGMEYYMAPELLQAYRENRVFLPDIKTDLYSLGVLIHEILLGKHVASGQDMTKEEFFKTVSRGQWIHDPNRPKNQKLQDIGGYSAEMLNIDICRLIRRVVSVNREERPSAKEWVKCLCDSLYNIFICPNCSFPCLIDTSKSHCPHCKNRYPILKLICVNGEQKFLDKGTVLFFNKRIPVSKFHRIGPETWIENLVDNVFRFSHAGKKWIKMPRNQQILVENQDKLKFIDLEASVTYQ